MKKIYNIIFPIGFLFLLPTYFWAIILVGNFIIDSLALYFIFKKLNVEFKSNYKKSIIKVWLIGFLSDFIGALFLFFILILTDELKIDYYINWIDFPWCTILAIPGVIVTAFMIYFVNKKLSFNKTDLTGEQIKLIAKYLAIFTAPYLMLVPLYW